MKVETGVAEMRDAIAKLVQRASAPAQGRGHFDAFAKVETLQRGLSRKMRKRRAKLADEAAQIASQSGDGNVVANVERGELLREIVAVGVREHPLREIVGKTLGEEVMAAEGLKGVMEDGRVAAMLEPRQQLGECAGRLVDDSREIGNGDEVEQSFNCVHARAPSPFRKNSIISISAYRRNDPRCSEEHTSELQ